MGTILFLIFLLFFIIPIVKLLTAVYRARRNARRFYERFRSQAGSPFSEPQSQQPPRPRKKIDPADGEFVAFEDIPGDCEQQQTTYTEVKIEQQIVDVEWEDIR